MAHSHPALDLPVGGNGDETSGIVAQYHCPISVEVEEPILRANDRGSPILQAVSFTRVLELTVL